MACALNELFFIGLYLLSFSSPLITPSLLQDAAGGSLSPGNPAAPEASTLFASPWSAGALEMARYVSPHSQIPERVRRGTNNASQSKQNGQHRPVDHNRYLRPGHGIQTIRQRGPTHEG